MTPSSMTPEQFHIWLDKLLDLYPVITGAALIGDRAIDEYWEESGWEVVVKLNESCYNQVTGTDLDGTTMREVTYYEQVDKIEQKITFDQRLCELDPDEDIALFFLRPDGKIGYWSWYDLDALAEDTITGSTDHLTRVLDTGMGLAKLSSSPDTIELAYALFGRVREGEEKRIRNQFKRARVLYPGPDMRYWLM